MISILFLCFFFIQQQFKERITKKIERKEGKIQINVIALIRRTVHEIRCENRNDRERVPLILAIEMDFRWQNTPERCNVYNV